MKAKRLLSFKGWSHIFRGSWKYLISPRVLLRDKLLFTVPVALYWVLPDLLPFLPIDDIGVTMLMMGWFVSYMERKYPEITQGSPPARR